MLQFVDSRLGKYSVSVKGAVIQRVVAATYVSARTETIESKSLAAKEKEPVPEDQEMAALPADFFENRTDAEKKAMTLDTEFSKFMDEVKQIDRKEVEAATVEDVRIFKFCCVFLLVHDHRTFSSGS